jgi:hypothetical protein
VLLPVLAEQKTPMIRCTALCRVALARALALTDTTPGPAAPGTVASCRIWPCPPGAWGPGRSKTAERRGGGTPDSPERKKVDLGINKCV